VKALSPHLPLILEVQSIRRGSSRQAKQGKRVGLNRASEQLCSVADLLVLYYLPWETHLPHHLLSRINRDECCVCLIFQQGIWNGKAISRIRATKRGSWFGEPYRYSVIHTMWIRSKAPHSKPQGGGTIPSAPRPRPSTEINPERRIEGDRASIPRPEPQGVL